MKMKKIIATALVGVMSISMLAGCGSGETKKKAGNSTTDIEIAYWNSGLGTAWLEAMIEGFEKKYPEYNVTYSQSASVSAVVSAEGLEDIDTVDLYLAINDYSTSSREPLDDVLESVPEGETKTIREKLNPNYLALEQNADGHVYSLSYGGGIIGLVYSIELFEKAGITQLPRTTDELALVCDTLHKKGITPICHFKDGGYYDFLSEAFFSQYNGMDYYLNNFYGCKDENGNEDISLDLLTRKDGRYETLKAYEKFVKPEYVLTGSNTSDHTFMQTEFLYGKCAMMVSGSWLSNEMEESGGAENFVMMKLPVISSITDNLETVKKESQLRKVITAVDNVTDGSKSVDDYKQGDNYVIDDLTISAADWEAVRKARNTMAANHSGDSAYIPSYSNAKEGAKEFLKYLYSDEGIQIYSEALKVVLPLTNEVLEKVDTSDWNDFEKSQVDLLKTTEQFATYYNRQKHSLFINGGASSYGARQYISYLCNKNEGDRKSADEVWTSIAGYMEGQYDGWLSNIK